MWRYIVTVSIITHYVSQIHRPDFFKGCFKNLIINSQVMNLDVNNALLHHVSPCFKNVEAGTFFGSDSHAIHCKFNFYLSLSFCPLLNFVKIYIFV